MKRLLFLAVISTFFVFDVVGQNEAKFTIGPTSNTPIHWRNLLVKNNFLYSYNNSSINLFNLGNLKNEKSLEYKNLPEGASIQGIQNLDEVDYIFYSITEKKANKLFVNPINLETGELTGEKQFITEISTKKIPYNDRRYTDLGTLYDYYRIFKNASKTKICVASRHQFFVFDKGMKLLWQNEDLLGDIISEKYHDKLCEIVQKDGTWFGVYKIYKSDNDLETYKKQHNYTTEIIKIKDGKRDRTPIKELKDEYVNSINFFLREDGSINLLGAYKKAKDNSYIGGPFKLNMNSEGKFSNFKQYEIPLDIVYQTSRNIPKKTATIPLTNISGINISNNNFFIVAERDISYDINFSSSGGEVYGKGDIIVAKINQNDELQWLKRAPKRQTHNGLNYLCDSYKYLFLNNKHYFVYMDSPKNKELDITKGGHHCHVCGNGYLRAYTFDEDGTIGKRDIFDLTKNSTKTTYNYKLSLFKLSEEEFFFKIFTSNKEEALVKINVKK